MKQKPGRVPLQGGTFSLSSWLLLQRYKDGELREHLSLAQSWKLWWYILLEMCRARRRGTCCPRPGKDSPYMLHSRCHEVMHDPSCRKRPLFAYVPNGTQMLNKLPTMFEAIIRPCLRSYVNLPRLNWPFPRPWSKWGSQPTKKRKWLQERFWTHLLKEAECFLGSIKVLYKLQRVSEKARVENLLPPRM